MKPILNPGHGGMIGGQYQTPGKRSPNWECGVLYEGMFNRWFVNRLMEKMDRAGLPYYNACPEPNDIPLMTRVNRANDIHRQDPQTYYLSIHANAGGGVGIEGFTSPGITSSDRIADAFLEGYERRFDRVQKMRFDYSDGDRDKERRFFELVNTMCPAVLIECGFMDSRVDYANLWSTDYLDAMVDSTFETIKQLMT